jgi:hypothetical protein
MVVAAGALAMAPLAATSCSSTPASMPPNIKAGDMPEGADWTGVYYSQLYGNLHLIQEGNTVSGKWIRPSKDRWGEVHGSATGDLVRFTWVEHTIGAIGPSANRDGKGYFKYKRPPGDNVDDTIEGEIGRGKDEAGDAWDAIKQRNVKPDPGSIGGTGTTDIGGGDWDTENKEKGSPEAPVSPPPP